jgi:hypothetical protein
VICNLEEFKKKNSDLMEQTRVFGKEYRFSKDLTEQKKEEIKKATKNGIAFID